MRNKTLFLGNGLNRTLNFFGWEDLMARLGSTDARDSGVPFPIEFEQIAARKGCSVGMRGVDPYKELRTNLAKIINDTQTGYGEAHKAFRDLPFNHFVTTNYDETFEGMYDLERALPNPGSSRNILVPVSKTKDTDFYHAHGIWKWKNTLCLGHEHYASLISKVGSCFYSTAADDSPSREHRLEKLIRSDISPLGIWPELFLTSDVAIVGFGFDYAETDLWWLLALRAALFAPCKNLSQFENRVTYYKAETKKLSMQDSYRLKALESLGVEIKRVSANTYIDAYKKMASEISQQWGA